MERVPAVEGLFTEEGGAQLLGSKCATCSIVYFPKAAICHSPNCDESKMGDFAFGGKGTLWSYSIQDFPPPPPHKFDKPYQIYALGVVDFPAGVRERVIARLAHREGDQPGRPRLVPSLALEPGANYSQHADAGLRRSGRQDR